MLDQDCNNNEDNDVNLEQISIEKNQHDDDENESPYSARKKLLKMNKKKKLKKRIIFDELSFVEPHVDTFYVGLRTNYNSSDENQLRAKTVDIDEADTLAKDWVNPDKQLVKAEKKSSCKKKSLMASRIERPNLRIGPLKFLQTDHHEKKTTVNEIDINGVNEPDNGCETGESINIQSAFDTVEEAHEGNADFLRQMFEDKLNITKREDKTILKTPSRYRVYVEDTPVEYYGVSVLERRRLGLDF